MLLDYRLVYVDTESIFGIQKRVQVSSWHMSFRMKLEEAQLSIGPSLRSKKWNVVVVAVEDAAHRSTTQLDSAANVRRIYILHAFGKVG
jgi:hypothetical protein